VELAASEDLLRAKKLEIDRSDEDRKDKVRERIVELAASEKLLQSKVLEIERADVARELKVQERIIELAASEKLLHSKMLELQRSNEELQQFAYICSHDLQEPLRVVANYTQLLSKRYKGKLDDKADQFIGFAVDAAKRMQDLINDLLAYSRLQTRDAALGLVDCSQVVKMALANLEMVLMETGAIVRCESLPTVEGDKSQLLQLFQNLIGNALKFRSHEKTVVDVSVRQEGEHWLFAVHDNGIGFDMQFSDRIFLIFQRLHAKENYIGSGIGLAVCKKIVLRHGGQIWVESKPNKGATFSFTLPVSITESQVAK
jgi:light-regulated signal transduction histidine kinase (bacteriophytochrome)